LIRFDFEDRYPDEAVVGSAISKREGVLLAMLLHAAIVGLILFGPQLDFLKTDPGRVGGSSARNCSDCSASANVSRAGLSSSSRA
jgi:hypothetical protein